MLSILVFVLILGGLVLIHELGHFVAARLFGVGVEEFSIGFPPRLVSRQGKKTRWTLGLLPLGGYVRIQGEDRSDDPKHDPSYFSDRTWKVRAAITASGVIFNLVAGVIILTLGSRVGMPGVITDKLPSAARTSDHRFYISQIEPLSPAEQAGLMPGDKLISVNGVAIEGLATLRRILIDKVEQPVNLKISRHNSFRDLSVIPIPSPQGARIGVVLSEVANIRLPPLLALRQGVADTGQLARDTVSFFGVTLKRIITGRGVPGELRGPVGIAALTGEVVAEGMRSLIPFAALITVNLAVLNTLPIPALDGGRLLFIILEVVRRRPVGQRGERLAHTLGFASLLLLILLVTYRDLVRLLG